MSEKLLPLIIPGSSSKQAAPFPISPPFFNYSLDIHWALKKKSIKCSLAIHMLK